MLNETQFQAIIAAADDKLQLAKQLNAIRRENNGLLPSELNPVAAKTEERMKATDPYSEFALETAQEFDQKWHDRLKEEHDAWHRRYINIQWFASCGYDSLATAIGEALA